MYYLKNKRTKSLSINHPLGTCLDSEAINDEEFERLLPKLLSGDSKVIETICHGYMKLAISIAGRYAYRRPDKADDLVSEAILGMVRAVHAIAKGNTKYDNLPLFITLRIHSACLNFLTSDVLLGSSYSWNQKRKKMGKEEYPKLTQRDFSSMPNNISNTRTPRKLWSKIFAPDAYDKIDLLEVIQKSVKTQRQSKIVNLKLKGFKLQEIANVLDIPLTTVFVDLKAVRKEIKKRLSD